MTRETTMAGRGATPGRTGETTLHCSARPPETHACDPAPGANHLPILAEEIAQAHAACRRSTLDALRHGVAAGHGLNEARRLVSHGDWVPWLKANVPGISVRTAQRYMAAAKRAGKNDTVSLFTLRDLAKPVRERVGFLDARRALILTPSTHPGFTFFTVVETDTWDATGFLRPVRDDVIEMLIREFYEADMPRTVAVKRTVPHRVNPWLEGAELVATPEELAAWAKVTAEADRKLDEFGYTGPRGPFPGEARP